MWLEIGAARAEVQEALNASTHRHSELISNAVRLARMESSLSPYVVLPPPQHNYSRAHHNGDCVIVLGQAVHVPNMQACQHRAEVQGPSAGEGIAEEEGAEAVRSVILQRHKAQGTVGPGEVHPHSQPTFLIILTIPPL
jgi:hypothetical protein